MIELDKLFQGSSKKSSQKGKEQDLVVSDDRGFLQSVRELYAIEGFSEPLEVTDISEEELWNRADIRLKHVILDMRANDNMLEEVSDIATRLDVSIQLIVVSNVDSIKIRDKIHASGAAYVLWDEELDGLLASVKRGSSEPSKKAGKTRVAKRVLFLGTKGGIGLSTVTSMLACSLVKDANLKTLVVDHDTGSFNGDIFLGVKGYKVKENSIDLNQSEIDSTIAQSYLCKVSDKLDYLALEKTLACLNDHVFTLGNLSKELVEKYNFIIDSVPINSFEEVNDQDLEEKYHHVFIVCEPSVSSLRTYNKIKRKIGKTKHNVVFSLTRNPKDYLITVANAKERIKCKSSVDFAYEQGLEKKIIQLGQKGLAKSKYLSSIAELVSMLTGKTAKKESITKFSLFKK